MLFVGFVVRSFTHEGLDQGITYGSILSRRLPNRLSRAHSLLCCRRLLRYECGTAVRRLRFIETVAETLGARQDSERLQALLRMATSSLSSAG